MSMSITQVRAEFARRKLQFHANENFEDISLFGLFSWGAISKYIKDGRVILNAGFTKENKIVWCKPSQDEWNNYILPLIESGKTLEEITKLAGW